MYKDLSHVRGYFVGLSVVDCLQRPDRYVLLDVIRALSCLSSLQVPSHPEPHANDCSMSQND